MQIDIRNIREGDKNVRMDVSCYFLFGVNL